VDVRPLPGDVLRKLKALSEEVVAEIAEKDPFARKVYASYRRFYDETRAWTAISEQAYLEARS